MTASDPRRPPIFDLTVLTGFLGAGKTTLLNRLLADPRLARTLVLINEFGTVGLDHLLVERVDGDMLLMSSGCLCCTIRGDLVATLEDVLRRSDNGRMSPFERVVIETTGLADPAPVLHTILSHPYLSLRFRLHGVVTLVDALVGMATLDRHPEAIRQAALADRLVLTKTDLLDREDGLRMETALRLRLAALNPLAPILDAAHGALDADLILDKPPYDPAASGPVGMRALAEEAEALRGHHHSHANGHDHDHEHAHDVNRHDANIRAFTLRHPRPVVPHALSLFLELLRSAHGPRLLRLKGLVALSDDPARPVVVHGVQHVTYPVQRLEAWPDADHETRLVFILQDLDPRFVEALWRAASGEPRVDEADLAARAENPLAPAPSGLLEGDTPRPRSNGSR